MRQTKTKLQELFLLWWNDFLTIEYFAEYHEISESRAKRIINIGRIIHNTRAKKLEN